MKIRFWPTLSVLMLIGAFAFLYLDQKIVSVICFLGFVWCIAVHDIISAIRNR